MELYIERPIECVEEDKLKRADFAKNLAEKINNYEYEDSLTLGLLGSWGCGKTSIINMMCENIDEKKVDVIEFNPWYFSGREQLLSDFFQLLKSEIGYDNYDGKETLSSIGEKLNKYSKILKPVSYIPQLAPFTTIINKIILGAQDVGDALSEFANDDKINIVKLKKEINEELKKREKKIIVVIDEIDRLEIEEAKQIFQIVKALGDFKNIIYLLSFDKEKIIEKIEDGENYLNKIINIPVYVPSIPPFTLSSIFDKSVREIFSDSKDIYISEWREIFKLLFKEGFKDLREVNRFLNILKFEKGAIIKEVNTLDYIVITYLKIFYLDIYNYIKTHKNQFIKYDVEAIERDFDIESDLDTNKLFEVLFMETSFRGVRRLSDKNSFDIYFQYYLRDGLYSFSDRTNFGNVKSKEECSELFNAIEDKYSFLENLFEISQSFNRTSAYHFLYEILNWVNTKDESDEINKYDLINNNSNIFEGITYTLNYLDQEQFVSLVEVLQLKEDLNIDFGLDLLSYIYNDRKEKTVNEAVKNKVKGYLDENKFSKKVYSRFSSLSKMGIDIKGYLEKVTNKEEGLLEYIEVLPCVIYEDYSLTYDDEGNIIDAEPYQIEKVIIEDIERYISYDELINKIDNLRPEVVIENTHIISLVKNPIKYEDLYDR
ncbi:MAG: KAP family NTPase [Firmicutes bacterium]|jgi:energy-coupling factor transporter ATP-binding protein EcfA2|nr:KAP family NTPase [Bacillota bacterium]